MPFLQPLVQHRVTFQQTAVQLELMHTTWRSEVKTFSKPCFNEEASGIIPITAIKTFLLK